MQLQTDPVLLYNDECGVCRRIARWVERSAHGKTGQANLVVRPIGEDPAALRSLNAELDIWDAYATIHVVFADGSMKVGGEAVAEVLRRAPKTRWLARAVALRIFGRRPFQTILNLAYAALADMRPLFGCESCGKTKSWLRPLVSVIAWVTKRLRRPPPARPALNAH